MACDGEKCKEEDRSDRLRVSASPPVRGSGAAVDALPSGLVAVLSLSMIAKTTRLPPTCIDARATGGD